MPVDSQVTFDQEMQMSCPGEKEALQSESWSGTTIAWGNEQPLAKEMEDTQKGRNCCWTQMIYKKRLVGDIWQNYAW